jgi:MoxR-like ATPase
MKACINGPPEFGDEAEFVMQSAVRQEVQIWTADVMLPFRFQEKCHTGVFQVRYAVDGHDGSFYEGSPPEHSYRIIDEVQRHYYHQFKLEATSDRCRGRFSDLNISERQAAEEALGAAMQEVFENRTQGQPELFLERVEAMVEDFDSVFERPMVEQLFDELLQDYQVEMRARPELILCMLAAVGAHGLTSSEKTWRTTGGYGSTGAYSVTAGGGGHYVYHNPPPPGLWERILMEMGVVTLLFPLNLRTCLGVAHFEWAVAGLVEMQERFAEHDSWQWLPLMAIIRKHYSKEPRVATYYGKNAEKHLDRYQDEVKRLLRSVCRLHEEAMLRYERALAHQQAQQRAQKQAGGLKTQLVTRVVTWQQQAGAQLARELLKCAITYAPSLELINFLLSPETSTSDGEANPGDTLAVSQYLVMLSGELQSYVESMELSDDGEDATVEQLQLVLLGHDGAFCTPSFACAMLRNDDLGGRDASSRTVRTLLHLVEMCIPDRLVLSTNTAVGASALMPMDEVDDVLGRADMAELVKGLKKWVETRHNGAPVDYYTNHSAPVSYGGTWVGEYPNRRWVKDTGPPPPAEEMARRQARCARDCLDDVDKLLRLKGGAMMGSTPAEPSQLVAGLLHEITRCHFLKGEPLRSLGAFVAVASSSGKEEDKNDGRIRVGERVRLRNPKNTAKCLKSGDDIGKLCKDDRTNLPFQVEAHGIKSWFKLDEIVRVVEPKSDSEDEDEDEDAEADALARYVLPLQSFMRQHGVRLVTESMQRGAGAGQSGGADAYGYSYDLGDSTEVARTITSRLSVESHFGRSLALALLHPKAAFAMEELEPTSRAASAVAIVPEQTQSKAQALVDEVTLGQVLANTENWRAVMEWCGGAGAANRPAGGAEVSWAGAVGEGLGLGLLGQVLLKAKRRLLDAADEAKKATITLSRLKEVLRRSYEFSRLLTYLGAVEEERSSRLQEHRRNLQRFDTTLAQLKQYIAFFCAQPTVKIDVVGLHQLTTNLRERYSQIHADEIVSMTDDFAAAASSVQVSATTSEFMLTGRPMLVPSISSRDPAISPELPCVVHLPWLHALRTSGLFLGLWRRCGRALCMEQAMGGGGDGTVATTKGVNWMAPGAIERFMRKASLDRLTPRDMPEEQEEPPTIPALFGGAMAQGAAEDEEPLEEQAAAEGRMVTRAEEVVLSQELVCETLLPMVQREWGRLFDGIRTLEISVTALDKACEGVPLGGRNTAKLCNELAMLTATAAPFSSAGLEGARTSESATSPAAAESKDGASEGKSTGNMSPREVAALAPAYTDCTWEGLRAEYLWMGESLSRLGDYLLLGRLRTLLPSLISLRKHVGPLLQLDEGSDTLFNQLNATRDAIQQATTAAEQQEARVLRAAEQQPAFLFGAAAAGAAGADADAFQPADAFVGIRPGYVFKEGNQGLGYYRDGVAVNAATVAAAVAAGECWACPRARALESQCGACNTDWTTPESVARAAAALGAAPQAAGAEVRADAAAVQADGAVGANVAVPAPVQAVRFDLGSLNELLAPIRDEIRQLESNGPEILEFMSLLGDCPQLVQWLLGHADTSEFNRLLQVCKSSTDDSRALKSLASIVHVRTLLLPILYPSSTSGQKDSDAAQQPVLQSFHEFLRGCENELLVAAAAAAEREREGKKKKGNKAKNPTESEHTESGLGLHVRHLRNVVSNFDHLLTVFSSSTRSPGIKAVHELYAIATRGTFTFLTNSTADTNNTEGGGESNADTEQKSGGGGGARFVVRLKATAKPGVSGAADHSKGKLVRQASGGVEKGKEEDHQQEDAEKSKDKEAENEEEQDEDEEADGTSVGGGAAGPSSMSMEELMDLRSKLMMTEVPVELEEQLRLPGGTLADYVKVFAEQVQLAIEIQLTLEQLQRIGHVDYQGSFAWTLPPLAELVAHVDGGVELPLEEGLRRMRVKGQQLDEELGWWRKEVGLHREQFYFLNYYTMLEVLRLANLCEDVSRRVQEATADGAGETELRKLRREQRIERLRKGAKAAAAAAGRTGLRRRRRANKGGAAAAVAAGDSGGGGQMGGSQPEEDHPLLPSLLMFGLSRKACKEALRHVNTVDAACDYIFSRPELMEMQDDPEEAPSTSEDPELAAALAASVAMSPGGADEGGAATAEGGLVVEGTAEGAAEGAAEGEGEEGEEEDDWYEDLFGWGAAEETSVGVSSLYREPEEELNAMLHLVLSEVDEGRVHEAVRHWMDKPVTAESKEEEEPEAEGPSSASSVAVLKHVGRFLDHIFEAGHVMHVAQGTGKRQVASRRVPLPSTAQNDLLITVRTKDGRSLPVWVACAPSPAEVIDVVLSVFARRGRLPEPGELLFCTTDTTIEQVEVLMRRFLHAEQHARSQCVFVVADVHMLTYTKQCAVVELLRRLLDQYGTDAAASLLLLSGRPHQVIINQLSSQMQNLPALEEDQLRKVCRHAFIHHVGETRAVVSTINGGGKTHWIMAHVAERQQKAKQQASAKADSSSTGSNQVLYRRIPIRENTTPATLASLLSASMAAATASRLLSADGDASTADDDDVSFAFHLDIGHIVPACVNTMLFQLLVLGTLNSDDRVYHRSTRDIFLIEIPNSPNNATAHALRFCGLLPTKKLQVNRESLSLTKPEFLDQPWCLRIGLPEYSALKNACKMLHAIETEKFSPRAGERFDLHWSLYSAADMSIEECFDILVNHCSDENDDPPVNIADLARGGGAAAAAAANEAGVRPEDIAAAAEAAGGGNGINEGPMRPSFQLFANFVRFMDRQFGMTNNYQLLDHKMLMNFEGLQDFKHVFCRLLVKTAQDFTLRSVPQLEEVGILPFDDEEQQAEEAEDQRMFSSVAAEREKQRVRRKKHQQQLLAQGAVAIEAPHDQVLELQSEAELGTTVAQDPQAVAAEVAAAEAAAADALAAAQLDLTVGDEVEARAFGAQQKHEQARIAAEQGMPVEMAAQMHPLGPWERATAVRIREPSDEGGERTYDLQYAADGLHEAAVSGRFIRHYRPRVFVFGAANPEVPDAAAELDMFAMMGLPTADEIAAMEYEQLTSFAGSLGLQIPPDADRVGVVEMVQPIAAYEVERLRDEQRVTMEVLHEQRAEYRAGVVGQQQANGVEGDEPGNEGNEGDDLARPGLRRQESGELRRQMQEAQAANEGRIFGALAGAMAAGGNQMADRFEQMHSWEDSKHPIVVFKQNGPAQYGVPDVSGVDVLSLNPRFCDDYINREMQQALEANGIVFNKDWGKLTNEEGMRILREVDGVSDEAAAAFAHELNNGYVLTVDNLLKMLSILLRLLCGLPAVVMGETGCGKSSLVKQLCAVVGFELHTLNVHGGLESADIIEWVSARVDESLNDDRMDNYGNLRSRRVMLFLDEINTCNCMGLFKEIVCEHSINGKQLPPSVSIIAACNPYRLRKGILRREFEAGGGLMFEHHHGDGGGEGGENVGTGIKDPLRDLVYRVHPLPEAMTDHIFDFGALSAATERLYIIALLRRQLAQYVPDADEDVDEDLLEQQEQVRRTGYYNTYSWWETKNIATPFAELIECFAHLICAAQEFVRELAGGERSAASLRDVSRCMIVYRWFGEHFAAGELDQTNFTAEEFFGADAKARPWIKRSMVMSLAYCYHARLPHEERERLLQRLCDSYAQMQRSAAEQPPQQGGAAAQNNVYNRGGQNAAAQAAAGGANRRRQQGVCAWLNLTAVHIFQDIIERTQLSFVNQMRLGPGIAKNEALKENLFMVLISVLNQIPIFVVGKPGSSKSLALGLLQANLNGQASENAFLKTLPTVEVFSYQCSPLSTSGGIEQVFSTARKFNAESQNTLSVVLLDEVGLAEQSPHLPLKVLHKLLDEALPGDRLAVVGISNWGLDPAKMNRAVHLCRPAPTIDDLAMTAEGMVANVNLKGYLNSLARGYHEVYSSQHERPDFWGLREFYSCVKLISTELDLPEARADGGGGEAGGDEGGDVGGTSGGAKELSRELLMRAVLRNFGGRPWEMPRIMGTFFDCMQYELTSRDVMALQAMSGGAERSASTAASGVTPVKGEPSAGVAASSADQTRENELEGGESDQAQQQQREEDQMARESNAIHLIRSNLRDLKARHLMLLTRNGAALPMLFEHGILSHNGTDILFGSDFPLDKTDMQVCLNIQRIKNSMAEGRTVVLVHCDSLYESLYDLLNQHYTEYAGQQYVRLAFGTHSRLCPIAENFRVVVVVEKAEAYTTMAPPLLNRFEKQVFERKNILSSFHLRLKEHLESFAYAIARAGIAAPTKETTTTDRPADDEQTIRQPSFKATAQWDAAGGGGIRTGAMTAQEEGDFGKASGLGETTTIASQWPGSRAMRRAFCGYHPDLLSSLALAVKPPEVEVQEGRSRQGDGENDVDKGTHLDRTVLSRSVSKEVSQLKGLAMRKLLWIATPEAVCRLMSPGPRGMMLSEFAIDPAEEYFGRQCHSNLKLFCTTMLPTWGRDGDAVDESTAKTVTSVTSSKAATATAAGVAALVGAQVLVMTHSPMRLGVVRLLMNSGELTGDTDGASEAAVAMAAADAAHVANAAATAADAAAGAAAAAASAADDGKGDEKATSMAASPSAPSASSSPPQSPDVTAALFGNDEASAPPPLQLRSISHVALHELTSERDLVSRVQAFFEEGIAGDRSSTKEDEDGAGSGNERGDRLLVVQCDPLATSLRRIEHAKFICETARARSMQQIHNRMLEVQQPPVSEGKEEEEDEGKVEEEDDNDDGGAGSIAVVASSNHRMPRLHVMLLLHLPRGSEAKYSADFGREWRCAFVDAMEPEADTGIPVVEALIGKTLPDIVAGLRLGKVLARNFRPALASVRYPYSRGILQVRTQIQQLLRLLEEEDFLQAVRAAVQAMLAAEQAHMQQGGGKSLLETMTVEENGAKNKRAAHGMTDTFQAALHRQVISAVCSAFAVCLAHMDRNQGLEMLTDSNLPPKLREVWLLLFNQSIASGAGLQRARQRGRQQQQPQANANDEESGADGSVIDVLNDGHEGQVFRSRFPYSFSFHQKLESLRSFEAERAVRVQVGLLGVPEIFCGLLSEGLMRRYVYDFAHMQLAVDWHLKGGAGAHLHEEFDDDDDDDDDDGDEASRRVGQGRQLNGEAKAALLFHLLMLCHADAAAEAEGLRQNNTRKQQARQKKKDEKQARALEPEAAPTKRKGSFRKKNFRNSVFTPAASSCVIEGYLEKQASKMLKQWQKRYFAVEGHYMRYYVNEVESPLILECNAGDAAKEPKGVLDLRTEVDAAEMDTADATTQFHLLHAGEKVASLRAPTGKDARRWVDSINNAILSNIASEDDSSSGEDFYSEAADEAKDATKQQVAVVGAADDEFYCEYNGLTLASTSSTSSISGREALQRAIPLFEPRLPTLAAVHARFWQHEQVVRLYYALMDVMLLDDCPQQLQRHLLELDGPPSSETHRTLLRIAMAVMRQRSVGWSVSELGGQGEAELDTGANDESNSSYKEWLGVVEAAMPVVEAMLELIDSSSSAAENGFASSRERDEWSHLLLLYTFVRDVASPMLVPPAALRSSPSMQRLIALSPDGQGKDTELALRTRPAFRLVLELLEEVSAKMTAGSGSSGDSKSGTMTQVAMRFVDYYVFDVCFMAQLGASDVVVGGSSSAATLAAATSTSAAAPSADALRKGSTRTRAAMAVAREQRNEQARRLLRPIDPELLYDFVTMLAGRSVIGTDGGSQDGGLLFVLSSAGRVAILRMLLQLDRVAIVPEGVQREVCSQIDSEISRECRERQKLDVPLAVAFCTVKEQLMRAVITPTLQPPAKGVWNAQACQMRFERLAGSGGGGKGAVAGAVGAGLEQLGGPGGSLPQTNPKSLLAQGMLRRLRSAEEAEADSAGVVGSGGSASWGRESAMLQMVARARVLLRIYGELLVQQLQRQQSMDVIKDAAGDEVMQLVEGMILPLLSDTDGNGGKANPVHYAVSRMMRIFLLKQLERTHGLSFLRSALQQPPLQGASWCIEWRLSDTGFRRLCNSPKLPDENPIAHMPLFSKIGPAVGDAVTSGRTEELEELLLGLTYEAQQQMQGMGALQGALLAAVFDGVFLLAINQRTETDTRAILASVDKLREWVKSSPALEIVANVSTISTVGSQAFKQLLYFFIWPPTLATKSTGSGPTPLKHTGKSKAKERTPKSGKTVGQWMASGLGFGKAAPSEKESGTAAGGAANAAAADSEEPAMDEAMDEEWASTLKGLLGPHGMAAGVSDAARSIFALQPQSQSVQILLVRVIVHVCAAGLAAPSSSPCAFFRRLLLAPDTLGGSYMPTMPEDLQFMVAQVLGGRWYKCSNGHAYYVDHCGRPTEINECVECGVKIGGLDHNLLDGNTDIGDTGNNYYSTTQFEEKSDPNYCLRPAVHERQLLLSIRDLQPPAVHLLRLLMHAPMIAGAAVFTGDSSALPQRLPVGVPPAGVEGVAWITRAESILNRTYVLLPEEATARAGALGAYFVEHFSLDWQLLRQVLGGRTSDDIALISHHLIHELGTAVCSSANEQMPAARAPAHPDLGPGEAPTRGPEVVLQDTGRSLLATPRERRIFEATVSKVVKDVLGSSEGEGEGDGDVIESLLLTLSRRYGPEAIEDGGSFRVLMADITERHHLQPQGAAASEISQEEIVQEEQRVKALALWAHRAPFSLEHFTMQLSLNRRLKERHLVLAAFLELEPQLRGLRHLPQLVEWQRLLFRRYSRRVSRTQARELTAAQVIAAQPEDGGVRRRWAEAFEGYCLAWNQTWRLVGQFGCLQFNADFKSMQMGPSQSIAFSMPCDSDEGTCALALTQFLVQRHNDFVQRVDERLLLMGQEHRRRAGNGGSKQRRRKKTQRAGVRAAAGASSAAGSGGGGANVISSRLLSVAHTLEYDLHGQLVPLIEKQCVQYEQQGGAGGAGGGAKGSVCYDFEPAERYLLNRWFKKPAIDLQLRSFEFLAELQSGGALASLRQKLPQEPLTPALKQLLVKEMTGSGGGPGSGMGASTQTAKAEQLLQTVEMCICFLQETGGSSQHTLDASTGEMCLQQYIQSVLLVEDAGTGAGGDGAGDGGGALLQQVRLKHLDAVWSELKEMTGDVMANVRPKYKEPLTAQQQRGLQKALGDGSADADGGSRDGMNMMQGLEVLLPAMRRMIVNQLTEDTLDKSMDIKLMLGFYEVTPGGEETFEDLQWFCDCFPEDLVQMSGFMSAYQFLEAA